MGNLDTRIESAKMIDLDEAERVEKAATAAPWDWRPEREVPGRTRKPHTNGIYDAAGDEIVCTDSGVYPPTVPDAEFIVFTRNHWSELIAELRELREWREKAQDVLDDAARYTAALLRDE